MKTMRIVIKKTFANLCQCKTVPKVGGRVPLGDSNVIACRWEQSKLTRIS